MSVSPFIASLTCNLFFLIVVAFPDQNLGPAPITTLQFNTLEKALSPHRLSLLPLQSGSSLSQTTQSGSLLNLRPKSNCLIFRRIFSTLHHLSMCSLLTTNLIRARVVPQSSVVNIVGLAIRTIPVTSRQRVAGMPSRMQGPTFLERGMAPTPAYRNLYEKMVLHCPRKRGY